MRRFGHLMAVEHGNFLSMAATFKRVAEPAVTAHTVTVTHVI